MKMTGTPDTAEAARRTATVEAGRLGGWLMALSPLGFAALIVLMAGVFGRTIGTSTFAEITRAQMDALGGAWVANRAMGRHSVLTEHRWASRPGAY